MKTSVVMTTYNGSENIVDQMESLRTQSQKIDEVLIFDDQSKDNTVDIVREFISSNALSDWSVIVNERNKGYRLNFLEGVIHATGDIIFYCDQDDIWESEKVQRITECFANNANIMVCGHDVTGGENDVRRRARCRCLASESVLCVTHAVGKTSDP